jgi:phosphatidate cytidylyltransferase
MSKSNLVTRTITGLLYGISLIGSLVISEYTFFLFFFVVLIIGLKEFYQLVENKDIRPQKVAGFAIAISVFFASISHFIDKEISLILISISLLMTFLLFAFELFRNKDISFVNIGLTILGVIYVAIPLSILIFLAFNDNNEYNYELTLSIFILVWLSDVGGYFAGVNFGKHKLLKRISPKKTWEGVFGGLILCLIGSYVLSQYILLINTYEWLLLGAIVCICSVIGDLIESMIKRSANAKDSGNLLPGHGGILDRFDSVLFVIPIVYFFKLFIL